MPMIEKNKYGIISVDSGVLSKMIIDNLLSFEDALIPCNSKGKMIRKGLISGYNEYNNAIEIQERDEQIHVKVYVVTRMHGKMTGVANQFFNLIEEDFEILNMDKPASVEMCIWGFLPKETKQPIENVRSIRRENRPNTE